MVFKLAGGSCALLPFNQIRCYEISGYPGKAPEKGQSKFVKETPVLQPEFFVALI